MAGICYSIKKNRIESGLTVGFTMEEDGTLVMNEQEPRHALYVRALDCATQDGSWGRLSFEADYPENMTCYVYARALNESMFYRAGELTKIDDFLCDEAESPAIKREFFERVDAKRHVKQRGVRVGERGGRDLCFVIAFVGEGSGYL